MCNCSQMNDTERWWREINWFKWRTGAVRQQGITWANNNPDSYAAIHMYDVSRPQWAKPSGLTLHLDIFKFTSIFSRYAIATLTGRQIMLHISDFRIRWKVTHLQFPLYLSGYKGLICLFYTFAYICMYLISTRKIARMSRDEMLHVVMWSTKVVRNNQ